MTDPKLTGRESLKDALAAELAGARPDFDAMLARVQPGHGEDVLEEHVDLGEPPAEIVEACDALRARIEGTLKARLAQAPVPPRFLPRRTRIWAFAGVLAAAAVLFMIFDPPAWYRGSRVDGAEEAGLAVDAARLERTQRRAREGDPGRGTVARGGRREAKGPGADAASVVPGGPPLEPVVPPEAAPAESAARDGEGGPERAGGSPDPVKPARSKKSIDERLAELDTRAQQKWGAGDLVGARRDFRKLVKLGGRRRQVQLAYAELFALARQRGEDLSGLWREYLRKFPRGRYAPEASAGLCRAATQAERAKCWNAHVLRFPNTRGAPSEGRRRGAG